MNAEQSRLEEARTKKAPWKKWGPYLSERQWGTVREDYSESGDAWMRICLRLLVRMKYSSRAKENRRAGPFNRGGRDDTLLW